MSNTVVEYVPYYLKSSPEPKTRDFDRVSICVTVLNKMCMCCDGSIILSKAGRTGESF